MSQPNDFESTSNAAALAIVRGELSSKRRWGYRTLFVIVLMMLSAVLSLWITEPRPLPLRLHVMFAALSLLNVGWAVVLSWILFRRNCPTAWDRIVTAWMALGGCVLMFAVALAISVSRDSLATSMLITGVGVPVVLLAIMMVRSAHVRRDELRLKLNEWESDTADQSADRMAGGLRMMIWSVSIVFALSPALVQAQPSGTLKIDEQSAQILADHQAAVGGQKRLSNVSSRLIQGELVKRGVGVRVEILQARPNRSLTKTYFPHPGTLIQGYDGDKAWVRHPIRGSITLPDAQREAIRRDAWFDRVESVGELFSEVRYKRLDKGTDRHILTMISEATETLWHFDRTSKLLSRIERPVDLGPKGKATIDVNLEDYRETEGIRMPWSIRTVTPKDEVKLVIKRVEWNVEVSDVNFRSMQ